MKRIIAVVVLALLAFYFVWPAFSAFRLNQGLKGRDVGLVASKIDFDGLRQSLRPAVERETEKAVDDALAKAGSLGAGLGGQLKGQFMGKIVDHALATLVTPEILIRIHSEGANFKDGVARIVKEQAGKLGGIPGPAGIGGLGEVLGGALGGNAGKVAGGLGGVGAALDKLGGDKGIGGLFGKKDEAPVNPVRTVPDPASAPAAAAPAAPAAPAPSYGLSNIKRFGFDSPLSFALGLAKDPNATEPDVTARMAFTGGDWKLVGLVPRAR